MDNTPVPFYKQLNEAFINLLAQETSPLDTPVDQLPYMAMSGITFNGANLMRLLVENAKQGNTLSAQWLTRKQANDLGGTVDPSKKVTLARWVKQGEQFQLSYFDVYNLNHIAFEHDVSASLVTRPKLDLAESKALLDEYIASTGITFKEGRLFQNQYAFYRPKDNVGCIPAVGSGNPPVTQADQDKIKLHLAVHSAALSKEYGTRPRAHYPTGGEELPLMLATMVLANQFGMDMNNLFPNHADYKTEWLQTFRDDPKALSRACAEASRIVHYMQGLHIDFVQSHQPLQQQSQAVNAKQEQTPPLQTKRAKERSMDGKLRKELNELNWTGELILRPYSLVNNQPKVCPIHRAEWFSVFAVLPDNHLKWVAKFKTQEAAQDYALRNGAVRDVHFPEGYKRQSGSKRSFAPRPPINADDVILLKNVYSKDPEIFSQNKARVKELGGGFDKTLKWFVPKGSDLSSIEDLVDYPKRIPQFTDPIGEFAQALREAGLNIERDQIIADGKIHRIKADGDRNGQTAGSYKLFLDGHPSGYIKNFRTGEESNWKAQRVVYQTVTDSTVSIPMPSKEDAQAIYEAKRQEREQELQEQYRMASLSSQEYVSECVSQTTPTAYLARKGFSESDLEKVGGVLVNEKGQLVAPLVDVHNQIWSHQVIADNGFKSFAKGGRKSENFTVLNSNGTDDTILICEGYATGLSIAVSTGRKVYAAMDAGNLASVSHHLREQHPEAPMVICADDDRHLPVNAGREKALAAAEKANATVVFPEFPEDKVGKSYTDFNDLAQIEGLGNTKVNSIVEKAVMDAQLRSNHITDKQAEIEQISLRQKDTHQMKK